MTGSVLVADGNRERARRVGEACAARGIATSFAPHGAAALEAALAEVPDVVIAAPDLPLIEGGKLVDILRANPRTQSIRFVLMASAGPGAEALGFFGEVLDAASPPDTVAQRVEVILAQRARVDAAWGAAEADHEVEGQLSQIPLPDLLQLFHMNRRTGRIELRRRERGGREERGTIWIREGNLLQAAESCVEGEKALFRLLAWNEGSFTFTPHRANVAPRIVTPTRALLMEGMRQLDEWNRLRARLPALDAQVVLRVASADLPHVVHPLTQEVLLLLELYGGVREVVDHCSHPDYQVLRTLQALADKGIVELRQDVHGPRPGEGAGVLTPAQVRRLRDWLQAGRPRGSVEGSAKLLVLSCDHGATLDFARLLGGLPGVQLAEAFRAGSASPEDFTPLAHLLVDPGLGIELLHVPVEPALAPLWPVAGHRALGALRLYVGDLPEAEGRLAPTTAVLRRLPGLRIFDVVLLRKGERPGPGEIQERLAHLDETSLVLLPLEGGKDRAALLRTLIGRVVP
jgi:CheY-like chemotaxis protein